MPHLRKYLPKTRSIIHRASAALYGRPAIIEAMKAYYHEFSDQVSTNDSIEIIGPSSVRTHWRLHATTKSSGRKVTRQGVETIHFNPKGLIATVEVQDVEPVKE